MEGFCELGNEPSCCIKYAELLAFQEGLDCMEFVSRSLRQSLWLWRGDLSCLAKQSSSEMEFQRGVESCVGRFVH